MGEGSWKGRGRREEKGRTRINRFDSPVTSIQQAAGESKTSHPRHHFSLQTIFLRSLSTRPSTPSSSHPSFALPPTPSPSYALPLLRTPPPGHHIKAPPSSAMALTVATSALVCLLALAGSLSSSAARPSDWLQTAPQRQTRFRQGTVDSHSGCTLLLRGTASAAILSRSGRDHSRYQV